MIEANLLLVLIPAIFAAAILYSSVGHGGASGYLAVMALVGLAPDAMKPAALAMNVLVTVLVFARLRKAGHFDLALFAPFALASTPMAFLGGMLTLDASLFRQIVGVTLLLASILIFIRPGEKDAPTPPDWRIAAPVGAGLGLLSGLTGVGGGIYLSPLVLLLGWTTMRGSAALAAAFILLNSCAGLAGHLMRASLPDALPWLAGAAILGAIIGSELGARSASLRGLHILLGFVLVIAGAKMFLTA